AQRAGRGEKSEDQRGRGSEDQRVSLSARLTLKSDLSAAHVRLELALLAADFALEAVAPLGVLLDEQGGLHGLEGLRVGVVEGACGGEDAAEHDGLSRLNFVGAVEGVECFAGVAGVEVGDAE